METPVIDFVRRYAQSNSLRLHMPGHKGIGELESLDITEIDGADSLYEADGIIMRSEKNAGSLFGCETFYSAEGSSLSIRAMLYLAVLYAKNQGKKPLIAAGRNAHKTFVSAAALLDFDIEWLCPEPEESYLSCRTGAENVEKLIAEKNPTAVYLTSPDYLGNVADIGAISAVCRKNGVLLLVDNAHGAYLKFLEKSRHPIDLGADICCDSAHKTLPVLTGGAYLHISHDAPKMFAEQAKNALALFGSTSPSYIILQSLDAANKYLADSYPEKLLRFANEVEKLKSKLISHGYYLIGNEPLKLTLAPKAYGYCGRELAEILLEKGIVCEFSDPDFTVMMLTPETGLQGLGRLENALLSISKKYGINQKRPVLHIPERIMTVREAALSEREIVPASESEGRILAAATVACPPAVPIVVSGERIDKHAVEAFAYYGIKTCTVVK